MGYVHDIHLDRDFDRTAFASAIRDIRELFRRSELSVVGPSGRPGTTPVLDDDYIGFNGTNHDCTCEPDAPWYHSHWDCLFVGTNCFAAIPNNDGGQPFIMDVAREPRRTVWTSDDRYWFYCKTRRKPYDQAVMLAMIALKHHLGEQIELDTKGSWHLWVVDNSLITSGVPGWSLRSVVALYEHVFPDRAPVQNILSYEGME